MQGRPFLQGTAIDDDMYRVGPAALARLSLLAPVLRGGVFGTTAFEGYQDRGHEVGGLLRVGAHALETRSGPHLVVQDLHKYRDDVLDQVGNLLFGRGSPRKRLVRLTHAGVLGEQLSEH
ncbi:hypothetical protein AB0O75_50465 [Streptomyces sp. NPDC088921]|uniref:hypothetical protein n=1 Tax=Streptomyces sp. NPDC088921 TaxID=3155062 RepID=UPI003447A293